MTHTSKVSIIMPVRNGANFLEAAIISIVNQTYEIWELIVIDDASTDQTPDIIRKFMYDKRIHTVQCNENVGIANARNIGISKASGDWISFLDGDDVWLPCKLEKQLFVAASTDVYVVHGNYNKIDSHGVTLNNIIVPKKIIRNMMLKNNYIGNLTGMYNAKKLGKVYNQNIRHEDYDLWLTLLKKTDSIRPDDIIASYRVHAHNLTRNKFKSLFWHFSVVRKQEECGLIKAFVLLVWHVFIKLSPKKHG